MDQNYIGYGKVAKFLHWTMAILILLNYFLGLTLEKSSLYNFHKQTGLTILLLAIIRIIWRIIDQYPAPIKSLSMMERSGAKLGHLSLYLFMLSVPLSGILMVNAHGYELSFWGVYTLPTFIEMQSKSGGHVFAEIHEILANSMMAIIGIHLLAALKHHLVDKNEVLLRMIPFSRRGK